MLDDEYPSRDLTIILKLLIGEKIIFVSPDTPNDRFATRDFPNRYNIYDVEYFVNVCFDEDDERMFAMQEFEEVDLDSMGVKLATQYIMYYDIMENLKDNLAKRALF